MIFQVISQPRDSVIHRLYPETYTSAMAAREKRLQRFHTIPIIKMDFQGFRNLYSINKHEAHGSGCNGSIPKVGNGSIPNADDSKTQNSMMHSQQSLTKFRNCNTTDKQSQQNGTVCKVSGLSAVSAEMLGQYQVESQSKPNEAASEEGDLKKSCPATLLQQSLATIKGTVDMHNVRGPHFRSNGANTKISHNQVLCPHSNWRSPESHNMSVQGVTKPQPRQCGIISKGEEINTCISKPNLQVTPESDFNEYSCNRLYKHPVPGFHRLYSLSEDPAASSQFRQDTAISGTGNLDKNSIPTMQDETPHRIHLNRFKSTGMFMYQRPVASFKKAHSLTEYPSALPRLNATVSKEIIINFPVENHTKAAVPSCANYAEKGDNRNTSMPLKDILEPCFVNNAEKRDNQNRPVLIETTDEFFC